MKKTSKKRLLQIAHPKWNYEGHTEGANEEIVDRSYSLCIGDLLLASIIDDTPSGGVFQWEIYNEVAEDDNTNRGESKTLQSAQKEAEKKLREYGVLK